MAMLPLSEDLISELLQNATPERLDIMLRKSASLHAELPGIATRAPRIDFKTSRLKLPMTPYWASGISSN